VEVFPAVDGPVPDIDPTRPHAARIYDYGLGGKNHFAADRAMADEMFASTPRPASCTPITTRWSWCTRGRC
jgi:hypothetical protein